MSIEMDISLKFMELNYKRKPEPRADKEKSLPAFKIEKKRGKENGKCKQSKGSSNRYHRNGSRYHGLTVCKAGSFTVCTDHIGSYDDRRLHKRRGSFQGRSN